MCNEVSFPQKVDTLTLKCVNFWKEKSHRFRDGIFFIYPQQNLFVFSGTPEISDFWGEASGGPKELCSNGES